MKTPEEIKKSLKIYMLNEASCEGCSYKVYGYECSAKLASDTLAYIKQLENRLNDDTSAESAPKWISVEDRLPDNEVAVLVYAEMRRNGKVIRGHVVKAFYTDGKTNTDDSAFEWDTDYLCDYLRYDLNNDQYFVPEGWWESVRYNDEFSAIDDFVTYWMPLPEPPKGVNMNA